jgi:hypothetical protein
MRDELKDLKIKYLFDETTGLIRDGLKSMTTYAKIINASDEDELDEIIKSIMDEEKDSNEKSGGKE